MVNRGSSRETYIEEMSGVPIHAVSPDSRCQSRSTTVNGTYNGSMVRTSVQWYVQRLTMELARSIYITILDFKVANPFFPLKIVGWLLVVDFDS